MGSVISLLLISIFACPTPVSLPVLLGVRAETKVPVANAVVVAFSDEGYGLAATNAQGRYLISEGLTTGTYNVTVLAEGYLLAETGSIKVTAGAESSGANFFLKLSGIVSGKVTDAVSAQSLQQIMVMAVPVDAGGAYGWQGVTDAEGKYRIATNLATGKYNLTAFFPDGHLTKAVGPISVTAGAEAKGVDLVLERSGTISGKVRSSAGPPLAGATVMAMASAGQSTGSAQTDADGNFKIASGLGTGTYTVYATYASSMPGIQQNIKVTQGRETTGIDFTLTVAPSGSINGRITDINGNPVALASVAAEGPTGSGTARTDTNGNYLISKGLGAGTYTVSANAAGYTPKNVTNVSVTVGQVTQNVNLKLSRISSEQSGKISGIVEGEPNPTAVRQPSTISCKVSIASVAVDGSLTVSGAISPARVGMTITISYATDGSWVTLGTAASGLDGDYSLTWTSTSPGSYQLRASWEGDSTYLGSVSSGVAITVTGKTPSPSPSPTSSPTPIPSPSPIPSPTSSPSPAPKSGCLIATATYGSELSPQVQFLRGFRDNLVLQTFAGSSFMTVFNALYYSFSPSVAATISDNEPMRQVMKAVLYPLIGILEGSYEVFRLLSFSPELGVVSAGLIASALIGLVYFAPGVLLLCLLKKLRPSRKLILAATLILAGSAAAIAIAEATTIPALMMASTGVLVLATISVATLGVVRTVSRLVR